jgi:hypothetical protein
MCINLDGKVLWESMQSFDSGGGFVIADGLIYIMNGNNGMLYLAKATSEGYQELAKAQVLQGKQIWALMALADGKLLCRDQKQLKCLDVGK